jgi:hypothetical protein
MAAKAGTLLNMNKSSLNSTTPAYLTFATLTTAASSGVYFDLTGYKADRIIIVADITASNVASASAQNRIKVNKGSTVIKLSNHLTGALTVQFTSNRASSKRLAFIGPLEVSRFKDSNERITISCSAAGCNVKGISAILIE